MKIKQVGWLLKHKFVALILLLVLISLAYFIYVKNNQSDQKVEYISSTVEKGTLISVISGTGQVSSSNQVDIKSKVSGDIVKVSALIGQAVKKGDFIAQIDNQDANIQIKEARASYDNAKLELDELLAPTDDYTLLQAENSLADAQDTLTKLKFNQVQDYQNILDDLESSYEEAYNKISDAFLDLPDIMTNLNNVLYSYEISDSEINLAKNSNYAVLGNGFANNDYTELDRFEDYLEKAMDDYEIADESYDINFDDYRDIGRYSDRELIEDVLDESIATSKKISDALKSFTNAIDFWVEYRSDKDYSVYSQVEQYQSDLATSISQNNTHLNNLLSYQRDIEEAKTNIEELDQNQPLDLAAAERSLKEKEEKLADLLAGATDLEIKNKELTVQQKYNTLVEAQQNWANYQIAAPFDGIIAELNIKEGDTISSSVEVATIITEQKIAEVTLNEVDAALVTAGQKVVLEFDAIDDLEVTGEIIEVDTIGTVNQGVVSYDIKIGFDVQDDRIKSGMSTSADIIILSKQDVLMAPINAVKTMANNSYVEILSNGQLQKQTVVTGASNDTMIEITDGLSEGDSIVTQTISNTVTTISSDQSEGPRMGGMMRAF